MQPFVKQLLSRATGLQQLVQAKVSEGQQQHHHAEAQLMYAVLENPHRKCSQDIPGLHSGPHTDKAKQGSASVVCQDRELTLCGSVIFSDVGSSGM